MPPTSGVGIMEGASNFPAFLPLGNTFRYSNVPAAMSAFIRSRARSSRFLLVGVSGRVVCSRHRIPLYRKSIKRNPVSCRLRTLPKAYTSVRHGNGKRFVGGETHIALDVFPDVEDLAAPERADVVGAFDQDAVLESVPDCSWVVFDAAG